MNDLIRLSIALRLAKQQATSRTSLVTDTRVLYHSLNPHPALSPVPSEAVSSSVIEQRENEAVWRQLLVQGVLSILLPTEDLENGCLRTLVAEVFAEMILGNGISGKACEGWLLWEAITRIVEVLQDGAKEEVIPEESVTPPPSADHPEESAPVSDPSTRQQPLPPGDARPVPAFGFVSGLIHLFVQYVILAGTVLRTIALTLATIPSMPARPGPGASGQSPVSTSREWQPLQPTKPVSMRPMVSMKLWSCISQLVELDMRMPWLSGFASLLQWMALSGPGKVGSPDGALDR